MAGLKLVSLLLAAMLVFTGCGDKKPPVMGMDELKVEINGGTGESATESTEESATESADGNADNKDADTVVKAPAFTQTERIDNRYTEDGILLVEGEFRGIEVSGEGYEAAVKAVQDYFADKEKE